MKYYFYIRNIFILIKFLTLQIQAASFNINPIQLNLSQENSIEKLEIINHHHQAFTVHLKIMSWAQKKGADYYQDSKDIIVVPPIVTINAYEKQLIRIALKVSPDQLIEKAYRLYITEIPHLDSNDLIHKGLKFSMRVSVPIFVQPLQLIDKQVKLNIGYKGQNLLSIKNEGHHFIHIQSIKIAGSNKDPYNLGRYILPQQELMIKKDQIPFVKAGTKVIVKVNNETINYDVLDAS